MAEARKFYHQVTDPEQDCHWCKQPTPAVLLSSSQYIDLAKSPLQPPKLLLTQVIFRTENLDKLKRYLKAQRVTVHDEVNFGQRYGFSISDPEGHRVTFVPLVKATPPNTPANRLDPTKIHPRIIHVGFVVRDRAAMEHFYKDILGFKPYWHGGMKDDQTDWEALQVPDGTDWVEFMLNVSANADKHTLGVMNHIALGVPDIHEAQKQLLTNGMKLTEEPKIGRDGKWQLNVYDPDDTRVEFMEFTPVEKPCCSEFTGPHPKP